MKRLALALVAGLALLAALPLFVPSLARSRGVEVGGARWCGGGVCLSDVRVGSARAGHAVVGWDASLHLRDATVPLPSGEGGGGGGWFRRVTVEGLSVEGTPLPPLSGEVLPHRALAGEGVRIDGESIAATVPTEFGVVEATLLREGAGWKVDARCDCTLSHPSLSAVPLAGRVRALGHYDDGTFTGVVRLGGAEAEVVASRTDGGFSGRFSLAEVAIADLYGALAPVVPEAERATIAGRVSGTGTFAWPRPTVEFSPALDRFAVDGIVPDELVGGPFTYPGRDETGAVVRVRSGEGTEGWLPLAATGPMLPAAVVACEDANFYEHAGYELEGMLAAAVDNREKGRIVRGGSTLTQQLAKNLFLDGERTYARKLRELLYAVELERELRKPRIMELYLNIVEWGPNIRGAKAASEAYFAKSPAGLLPEEAAFLASILRHPRTAWERQYRRERPDMSRIGFILDGMRSLPDDVREAAKRRTLHLVPQ